MGLRPGRTIKPVERPYTRVSIRVPKKGYVVGVPQLKLHQFEMGDKKGTFDLTLYLVSREAAQMREQALEAGRIVAQKFLESRLGIENYFLKILIFPHQIIREKPIATGAGADRYSQGMARSFGKAVASAFRIKKNQRLIMLKINKNNLETGKQALKKLGLKICTTTRIEIEE